MLRVGMLTSGGDCQALNAAMRGVVKTLDNSYGDKVEYASVQTISYDKNGKQLGSPVRRNLIRTNGGRWYVRDYEIRF